MSFNIGGTNEIQSIDISGMDIESAMMMVQSQRAQLLEGQLHDQLNAVNERNKKMASMNETMNAKRTEMANMDTEVSRLSTWDDAAISEAEKNAPVITPQAAADFEKMDQLKSLRDSLNSTLQNVKSDADWIGLSNNATMKDNAASSQALGTQLKDLGITDLTLKLQDIDGNGTLDAQGSSLKNWVGQLDARIDTAGKLPAQQAEIKEVATQRAEYQGKDAKISSLKDQKTQMQTEIDNLKTSIDSEGSSQQMDMLRLQSLTNKRNEAFDMMSNFIKKMQDNRSGIISNMR